MTIPLLATRLAVPPRRPGLVARPGLIERLNQLVDRKLALISAPAGFGKTTFLVDWARRAELPVAWLSMDEGDDDVARFLGCVVAAWAAIEAEIRDRPLGLLAGSLSPPVDRLLSTLLDEAAARPGHFALVLDDYHLVTEPAIHDALAFVVEHLPPQMHLVISGRTDPPLPLARLRARGQLIELRADDLRFTTDQAVELFRHVAGFDLAAADVAALTLRTEGWIAGLQLAALSLRGGSPLSHQVEAVSGSDRHIADYLAAEVLGQQPEEIRAFLQRTAILERLSGPLCDAVTGRADGQAVLEALDRANLFLVPLDNRRQWYRYHQLFAEFLRSHLEKTSADEVTTLHRRASAWYADNGFPDEAFRHAVSGQDFERAARVVEEYFALKLGYGQYRIVGEWLQSLPGQLLTTRPLLGIGRALFLMFAGQPTTCLKRLEEVERHLNADVPEPACDTRVQLARVASTRAILACFENDLERVVKLANQAFQGLPEDDLFFRFAVNIALGDAYRRSSQWLSAVEPYQAALRIARRAPIPFIGVHPLSALGDLSMMRGQLRRAGEFRREALHLISDQANRAGVAVPLMGWAHIRMGELLYEWNDLPTALHHLQQGAQLAELGGDTQALVFGHLAIGKVRLARGDVEGAFEEILRVKPLVEAAEMPEWGTQLHQFHVRIWLAQGNLPAANGWVEETRFGVDDERTYRYEIARVALAQVLIAQGERGAGANTLDRALVLLGRLLQLAEAAGRMAVVVEALALEALAQRARGDSSRAFVALERALRLAEPEGYVRLFVDLGPAMAALLHEAHARGLSPDYLTRLLAAFGAARPVSVPTSSPLVDPLSAREIEVLRLVAAGLSNREIADALVIAVGTVKRHVATVYEKLGVNSRTQALARARELRLLA
ncbi:MAG: helix-turn-helix transcriptional regulator [Chloroflexi bacterium]|nr:helix-turn-helix transcriptional regulator [Chloroflexota bacterium]